MKNILLVPLAAMLLIGVELRAGPCLNPYTITFTPGYTLFANQLNNLGGNGLDTILAGAPRNTRVYKYDAATTLYTTYTKLPFGWNQNVTLDPGEGAWLYTTTPFSITFVGTPNGAAVPVTLTGYHLLSNQLNCQADYFDIVGFLPVNNTAVFKWPGPLTTLNGPFQTYVFRLGTWFPFPPTIEVGESVFIGPAGETIEGTVFDDSPATCIAPGAGPLANVLVELTDIATSQIVGRAVSAQNGGYVFTVAPGNYSVSQVPIPCWNVSCPGSPYLVTVNPGNNIMGQDFGNQIPGGASELSVQVYATYQPLSGVARTTPCCGQDMYYRIVYRNKCAPLLAGATTLSLSMSSLLTYVSHTTTTPLNGTPPTGFNPVLNTLNWTLGAVPAEGFGYIDVTVNVSPSCLGPTPALVSSTATIPPVVGEVNTSDNTVTHNVLTTCSFDPNDKEVSPKGCGPGGLVNGTDPFTYTVHFQNLGSGPAFEVVVRDTLDTSLDLSTLQLLGASHIHSFALNGQEAVWTFPQIFLPAASVDEPGSHGHLTFRVTPLAGLAEGTVITNRADIYFDLNPPVLTPVTTNTITLIPGAVPVASFTVAPRMGSAGHTNDFTYTGASGDTFLWDFGTDAVPPTSTDMNPSEVYFPTPGLRTVTLMVSLAGCQAAPATYLLSVGQPTLHIRLYGEQVCLSWEGDGYSLQQTDTLESPIPWGTINPAISQSGATHFVCLDRLATFRCYRLTDQ